MRARDIMTANVVTVGPDDGVHDVARLLLTHRISAVPVLDAGGQLVGIVSEGDLMRRPENETERHGSWWLGLWTLAEDRAREYVKGHGRHACEVMTRDVVTVTEDTSLAEIAELLEERRVKRVPVVRDGRLVGIVSRANLLHGLATTREAAQAAPSEDDHAIRQRVVATLEEDLGVTVEWINVIVRAGMVELWGEVGSAEEKRAIFLATENTPGVQEIRDHIFVPSQSIRSLNWGL